MTRTLPPIDEQVCVPYKWVRPVVCRSHLALYGEEVLATHRHRLSGTQACDECADAFNTGTGPVIRA